jgi:hypothetical protein
MGKLRVYCALAAACLCVFLGQSVFADTVTMTLTSAGNNILGDVYVGPYTATINGQSSFVICDDYADETYRGESWQANAWSYSALPVTNTGYTLRYDEAAWLIQQMFQPNSSTQLIPDSNKIGELQYAVWDLLDFNPGANPLSDLSSGEQYDINGSRNPNSWLNLAAENYGSVDSSEFTIFTPTGQDITCPGGPCSTTPPQEFIAYRTPEPSAVLILLADLLLFGTAAMLLRRRGILSART